MISIPAFRPFLAVLFALTVTLYLGGCSAPTEESAPVESKEAGHDHEHAEGEAHDHDHAEGEKHEGHEHAEGEAHEHAEGEAHDHDHAEGEAGHSHPAPHGGTLIALGDHFAHVELVLNKETGELTAYVLDGGAENPIRIEQTEISILIGDEPEGAEPDARVKLALAAVANDLTGEKVGDSSEFKGTSTELVDADHFHASLESVTIKGQTMEKVFIHFPDGNE